jgi:hypothetical protein
MGDSEKGWAEKFWVDGVVLGDFSEEESWWKVTGQVLLGLVPYAGQVADIRDIAANIKGVAEGKDGAWLNLGLAGIGIIPLFGDLAKGGVRLGRQAAKEGVEAGLDASRKVATEAGTGGAKTADAIPRGNRLPRTKGKWESGVPGDGAWKSDIAEVNAVTKNEPIPFSNGYPDFSKWSQGKVELPNMKGTDSDFGAADALWAKQHPDQFKSAADVERFRQGQELTWHHHQDGKTMQLIPTPLHGNIPHAGGASLSRNANQGQ